MGNKKTAALLGQRFFLVRLKAELLDDLLSIDVLLRGIIALEQIDRGGFIFW